VAMATTAVLTWTSGCSAAAAMGVDDTSLFRATASRI